MTSFHDLITNRRSIRRYTDEEISADDVKTIMEAALMAPTSKSSRPWQFVIVEDSARLEALSKCKEAGAMPIAKAPLAIVVAVDVEASDPWIEDAAIVLDTDTRTLYRARSGVGNLRSERARHARHHTSRGHNHHRPPRRGEETAES